MPSSVDSTITSTALIPTSDPYRRAVVIENTDANRLYVLLGDGTASSANFSFSLASNENACLNGYHGTIMGIWAADGTGAAKLSCY